MISASSKSIVATARTGAWFGAKASLAIFGTVYAAIYGGTAGWWIYVRLARGASAAAVLIDKEGGARALFAEFLMATGRVIWLTLCCALMSAAIFAVCRMLGHWKFEDSLADVPHPLD
jgi:hypothetical protein